MTERIAVVAHIFYEEIWPDIANAIRNLLDVPEYRVDIFLTYPVRPEDRRNRMERALSKEFPAADLVAVPNRGWDVGPFFLTLNKLKLDEYSLVVKLHTKRDIPTFWINFWPFHGGEWRRSLLSFCATPKAARRTLRAFRTQPRLGMVAGERVIDPCGYGSGRTPELQAAMVVSVGLKPRQMTAVYGTMWAVRAQLLRPLWRRYSEEDFCLTNPSNPHAEYGLAGDWEGAFGMLIRAQGYNVSSGILPGWAVPPFYWAKGLVFRVMRFLSDSARGIKRSMWN